MSSKNMGDDLKAMAQDVADLGAGYLRMGRRWLEIQRQQVGGYDRGPQETPPGEGRDGPRGSRPGPHAGKGPRRWRGAASAGMDSYLDDDPSPGYASPGSTQPPFASSERGPDSDYLPPGSPTYGRASYRGVGPKNYTRSDQRITEDLCEALTRDAHVDPSDISVNVSGGVVTLGGTVRNRWMKHRIEDLAAACEGVRSVENGIQIPAPHVPPNPPSATGSTGSTGSTPSSAE